MVSEFVSSTLERRGPGDSRAREGRRPAAWNERHDSRERTGEAG